MKKALLKDTFREIKKSFGRFISIFGIVLVGVAFFAGVKASSPYMKNSADAYFDKANLMDFRLLSTIGFTDDDVDAVGAVDGIEGADGAYSVNVITNIDTSEKVVNVMSYEYSYEYSEFMSFERSFISHTPRQAKTDHVQMRCVF